MSRVRLTLLVENRSIRPEAGTEHGLAVLVETGAGAVLFDTGSSGLVLRNCRALGLSLAGVSAVALSHGHYDHSGGLGAVMDRVAPGVKVYLHPEAINRKYAVREGQPARNIGMPQVPGGSRLAFSVEPQEIIPGVRWLGQVPRETDYEDPGGPFFLDAGGRRPDPLLDDTALLVSTPSGPVLVSGCAHAGIVNTLRHAARCAGGRRFAAVLGGMHLQGASAERIARTVSDLGELEIDMLGPAHCTGRAATLAFKNAFGQRCRECHAGAVLEF
jgi:7,8-dihydropterin-6-yl-methyl-4-(beta-D-ribofuranosyl)aminobenzene 5'-phosphate synthase